VEGETSSLPSLQASAWRVDSVCGVSGYKLIQDGELSGPNVISPADRFPVITAARTARTGLLCGAAFGLVQDALFLARGRRLAYVDFLLGTKRRQRQHDMEKASDANNLA